MPTRKKEIIASSLDATETTSPDSQELLKTKPVRPSRPKRNPAQPKVTKETSATVEPIEPTETIESLAIEVTETLPVTINKKQRKETHTKEKFYIRNDLLERLKALTKGKGKKSFKTTFINDALEKSLNELETTKE